MKPTSWPMRFAALAGLEALAVAQPVLDLTADSPEFFILRKSPDLAVVAFALWLVLAIPALLLLLEWAADRIRPGAGWALHLVVVGVYLALLALLALKRADTSLSLRAGIDAPGWLLIVLALTASAALVWTFRASRIAHEYLAVLALAAPVVATIFLLRAPIGPVALPEPVEADRPAPVVMVIFDELPTTSLLDERGQIDKRRVPNFYRLTRTSTWFSSATTVSDATPSAVPAILSGRRPTSSSTAPGLRDWPRNLFTLLRGQYLERSVEPATRLCPDSACGNPESSLPRETWTLLEDSWEIIAKTVAPHDIADDLPPIVGEQGTGAEPRSEVNDFLARLRPHSRPALWMLHVFLPHHPWRFLPSGRRYPTPGEGPAPRGGESERWTRDARLVKSNWRRHLLQVGYADTVLGKILSRLARIRTLDRALVIVTADHGVSFEPGRERRRATPANLDAIASVPLFIKRPHQRRRVRDAEAAETIDIAPTVLDILDATANGFDGSSLMKPRRRRLHTLRSYKGAVITASTGALLRQRRRTLSEQSSLLGPEFDKMSRTGPP